MERSWFLVVAKRALRAPSAVAELRAPWQVLRTVSVVHAPSPPTAADQVLVLRDDCGRTLTLAEAVRHRLDELRDLDADELLRALESTENSGLHVIARSVPVNRPSEPSTREVGLP